MSVRLAVRGTGRSRRVAVGAEAMQTIRRPVLFRIAAVLPPGSREGSPGGAKRVIGGTGDRTGDRIQLRKG